MPKITTRSSTKKKTKSKKVKTVKKWIVYQNYWTVPPMFYLFDSEKEAEHFFELVEQARQKYHPEKEWTTDWVKDVSTGVDLTELANECGKRGY